MSERVGRMPLSADGVRLDAGRSREPSLRAEPLLRGEIIDQAFIGHDPILSGKANIARADLKGAGRLANRILRAVSDGQRIKEARKAAGLNQTELGERMGVSQPVVSDWEKDALQSWRPNADKLAKALGKPPGFFAATQDSATPTQGIPVVGHVEAGVFRLAIEIPPAERPIINVGPRKGYEGVNVVALQVRGPSMDLLYPDGSYVIVASVWDTDVRDGDRVVVYRSQGELREATVKEARFQDDGRIALWPRSTHPDFQEPIYLDENDQDKPEIAYVVIARYQDEDRPAPVRRIVRKTA